MSKMNSKSCQLVPEDFFKPWAEMFKQMEKLTSVMDNFSLKEKPSLIPDKKTFQVNIDVQHFSPEEISVKVVDGYVVIKGKHEEKEDDHGFISRQFERRYSLPAGFLPDAVKTKLSSDGVLVVTAHKVLPLPSTGERIVPIVQTGPVRNQLGVRDFFGAAHHHTW